MIGLLNKVFLKFNLNFSKTISNYVLRNFSFEKNFFSKIYSVLNVSSHYRLSLSARIRSVTTCFDKICFAEKHRHLFHIPRNRDIVRIKA